MLGFLERCNLVVKKSQIEFLEISWLKSYNFLHLDIMSMNIGFLNAKSISLNNIKLKQS